MPKASRKGFFAVSEAGAKLARAFESKATQKLTEIIQKFLSRIRELKDKVMKAPKKLYLRKRNKLPLEVARGGEWHETDPQCIYGSIEYIRTDVFIGEACVAYCKVCDTQECDGTYECDWVAKFRRKLKKEIKQE